jgi:heme A synthase
MIIAVVIQAWRTQWGQAGIARAAALVGISYLVEVTTGILMLTNGFTPLPLALFVAAAATLWTMLIVLTVQAGLTSSHP